jgi:hypothetical protein
MVRKSFAEKKQKKRKKKWKKKIRLKQYVSLRSKGRHNDKRVITKINNVEGGTIISLRCLCSSEGY